MIGTGSIAGIMAGTIKEMDYAQNYAMAARNYGRAAEFTQKYSFEKICGSYEGLVEDTRVEPVYIVTSHSYHYEHIRLCLNHEKRVPCEKSFTVNESWVREVLELAREKKPLLTEAIRTRYMSMRKILDNVLLSGVIGRSHVLTASLGYVISRKERITRPKLVGGVLSDMGIRPLSSAPMVLGDEVDIITGTVVMTETGVDARNSITITYKDGRMAVPCSSAVRLSDHRGTVYGDNGFIEMENINNHEDTRIYDRFRNMIVSYDTSEQTSGYEYEVEACLRAIEEGALKYPEMPYREMLRIMGWIDKLRRQQGLVYPMEK